MKPDQDTVIQTLKEQNKHLLDRLEKAYEDKSELRRKLHNGSNDKLPLNMKRGDPTKEGTD
jgi:hypothetical protein